MKSAIVLSLALLFASATLAAQNSAAQSLAPQIHAPQQTLVILPPVTGACPVSLRAQHGADGNTLRVDKSRPKGLAQLLHLTLANPDARQIVEAQLRIHGLNGKGRVTQTASTPPASSSAASAPPRSDAVQTLVLRFSPSQGKAVSGDLWVPGMTAVLSIDLDSVTYADGSTRKFSARDACHVSPDLMMLIATP